MENFEFGAFWDLKMTSKQCNVASQLVHSELPTMADKMLTRTKPSRPRTKPSGPSPLGLQGQGFGIMAKAKVLAFKDKALLFTATQ